MTVESKPVPHAALDVGAVVAELKSVRRSWRAAQGRSLEPGGRDLPSRDVLQAILADLRGVLFPMRLGPPELRQEVEDYYVGVTLDKALHALLGQVRLELQHSARHAHLSPREIEARALTIVQAFADALPGIRRLLDTDVLAAFHGDPAAHSVDEVLLCYPGVHAIINHRLAHTLHGLGATMLARLIAEIAHGETGIDIHPGARIGSGFFIDHGTGVVIGETATIGERVRIYQAVTLGAKRFPVDAQGHLKKGLPRHPNIEDDVVIYAGATVLGRVTIGAGATIGGNLWVTHDVPPGVHLTQARFEEAGRVPVEVAG
ncbi:serine O-acetyltransferase EpsC [Aquabacterium sp. A08]|uniref:serine O-acetyltransferase EpsC n=1 Tax=Aquabacterium sp. A08 TaxID=2718532 RepID=UPI0014245B90|nr:serine O-acetyltransferase EpsC [Aquabacterium sp. A08]NIC43776.1 serine acetyltransferase [Aquabacterium sp. A08]